MVVDGALQVTNTGRPWRISAHGEGGIGVNDDLWRSIVCWCWGGGGESCCWLGGDGGWSNSCVGAWVWAKCQIEALGSLRAQENPGL